MPKKEDKKMKIKYLERFELNFLETWCYLQFKIKDKWYEVGWLKE